MSDATFDWVPFYKEFADKLLAYKDNRKELIEKVEEIFNRAGLRHAPLETDGYSPTDIDPFTIYGFFNSQRSTENRISLLKTIRDLFNVKSAVPKTFDGIPVVQNQNSFFYRYLPNRGDTDIPVLWNLFENALRYADNQSPKNQEEVAKYFDLAIRLKGLGNSKLTMGLFWIAPEIFLNLDSRNLWYLYRSKLLPSDFVSRLPPEPEDKINFANYLKFNEVVHNFLQNNSVGIHNFLDLSYEAWLRSEEDNRREKEEKKLAEDAAAAETDTFSEVSETGETTAPRYWLYSPGDNASEWDEFHEKGLMAIGWDDIGDLSRFKSRDEMGTAMKEAYGQNYSDKIPSLATWQFAHDMKPGDIIFAKKGRKNIIGRGTVASDYIYDASRGSFKHVRKVQWDPKVNCEYPDLMAMKVLTDITSDAGYVQKLNDIYDEAAAVQKITFSLYGKDDFLREVYLSEEDYESLRHVLFAKQNVILQGAPGVGKTYAARRLAWSVMGEKDPNRIAMLQFHQSYSYEDFIMGFRPTESGFELRKGAFYSFCKKAEENPDKPYFLIIDEINRGNLSKIFGELFMLIEKDKRGIELQLLYSGEKFSVPDNLYIIGTMNTADRSLAMLDYALRRRFSFFEMKPGFESEGFKKYQEELASPAADRLIGAVKNLNSEIAKDDSLGDGFCIGHSYFADLKEDTEAKLSAVVEYDLIPLLKEYWFDEPDKVRFWADKLRSALK
jgi:5-methylcytosine-specific restriction protein B